MQDDKGQEQQADRDPLPGRIEAAEIIRCAQDGAVDEHAQERACHLADPAAEQRPANHDRRDGIELQAEAVEGIAGLGLHREDDSPQRRAKPAQGVKQHLGARHRQAHQEGGGLVAADGVDVAPEACQVGQPHPGQEHRHEDAGCEPEQDRAGQWKAEARHRLVKAVVNRHLLGAHDERQAAREEHSCQRDEEWRQLVALDEKTHARAERGPREQRQSHGRHGMKVKSGDQCGHKNRGEGQHGTNAQIDAAGQDDEREAHRDDSDVSVVHEKVRDHAQREEVLETRRESAE